MSKTWNGCRLQSLEFSRQSQSYRARYDRETCSADMAVVSSLSSVLDVDPIELEPIQYSVDTDALNDVVDHADDDTNVSFEFEGYEISVSTDGIVDLTPPDEGPAADIAEGIN
ncbi:HalOD1 output domain-containing protein [Natranaeroarchaeum sulfidigenes]|uniref:Halobacterial output domain-containing protein n=1 Tax=Natranaeroarchaeum sulfidigenes TaxID=2784880 RepID=A0A897MMF5_9EURY|nr:HalOD1 output domain-containing protein [Natranaeroarchaeum sulfidigenes]QSG01767.1 Uncharacterized protein AArcS_0539 [Natranaeroarchaeum sulfidigenes]